MNISNSAEHSYLPGVVVKICTSRDPSREGDGLPLWTDNNLPKPGQENNTVTKYIISDSDQSFSIKLSVNPPFRFNSPAIIFKIIIDGVLIRVVTMRGGDLENRRCKTLERGMAVTTDGEQIGMKWFKFPPLKNCKIPTTGFNCLPNREQLPLRENKPRGRKTRRNRTQWGRS
jgi:hypothetical protein